MRQSLLTLSVYLNDPVLSLIVFCLQDEKKRVEELGGCVVFYGAWRVNGSLSVSRAIGKQVLKFNFIRNLLTKCFKSWVLLALFCFTH